MAELKECGASAENMESASRRPAVRIWRRVCGSSIIEDRRSFPQITRAFDGPDPGTRRSLATRARNRAMTSFAEGQPGETLRGRRLDDSAELYRLLVATVRDYAIFALDADGTCSRGTQGASITR